MSSTHILSHVALPIDPDARYRDPVIKNLWLARQSLLPHIITLVCLISIGIIEALPHSKWILDITDNYLWIHTSIEIIGILVSFAVFTVGWATYQNVRSTDILALSVISFLTGLFDLGHTLSFTGMPDFITPSGPNKAIDFWLASRVVGSLGFLYVSLNRPRKIHSGMIRFWWMLAATAVAVTCFYLFIFEAELLPTMFIPGEGLTPLKKTIEWLTICISVVSGVLFFTHAYRRDAVSMHWMGSACLIFGMAGFFFTIYREFDDLNNFAGHVYKTIALLLVYRAVFVECVSRPFEEARLRAQEALEANISKSRFLANVSHELRTPLGVISGFSDLLNADTQLAKEPREWAATIGRNSRQLRGLIDDLLDLSKAENEKLNVEWSEFSVTDVVEEVIGSLHLQASAKNIRIEFVNELPIGRKIKSDEVRFRQILTNIAGNAVKFTSVGQVRVTARERNSEFVEIAIKDTGIGITASDAGKLFQPFAQASDPAHRRFGGTGLGLALSRKLSTLLGGDLVLKSSLAGEGSEFVFWIKNQEVEIVPQIIRDPQKAEAPDFSQLKILAAEDSADNRSLLALYLKPTKAQLTFAVNGQEALELALAGSFDLVLMDLQMPVMDGLEAVAQLRANGFKTAIVALTAHAHAPERERAMRTGFDGYLVKPLSRLDLWKSIQKMSS